MLVRSGSLSTEREPDFAIYQEENNTLGKRVMEVPASPVLCFLVCWFVLSLCVTLV